MIPRGLVVGGLSLRGVGGEVVMVGFLFGLLFGAQSQEQRLFQRIVLENDDEGS